MSDLLTVESTYLDTGSSLDADKAFYRSIPNISIRIVDPDTGRPAIPLPEHQKALKVILAAVLSSSVLAQTIKSWLEVHPTRIEITVRKNDQKETVVFEGPNLKESEPEIEKILNRMTSGDQKRNLTIVANHKPHKPHKPTDPCKTH
jgi:hypothetical protein